MKNLLLILTIIASAAIVQRLWQIADESLLGPAFWILVGVFGTSIALLTIFIVVQQIEAALARKSHRRFLKERRAENAAKLTAQED